MATYQELTDGRPDGAHLGQDTTDKVGLWGVTPVVQPSGAAQAQLSPASLVTSLAGFGFYTATLAACFVGQVDEIRRVLVEAGIMKGSA